MLLAATMVGAQDLTHYKRVIKELSSAKYQGRGYAQNGANKAGKFLQREFEKAGVDEVTLQPFKLDINTFCGKMQMWADDKKLRAGVDFSMREYSPGIHGEFPVYHVDTLNYDAERMFADLAKSEYANCLVACEFWFTYKHRKDFSRLQKAGECNNAGLIYTWEAPIKFFKAYGEKTPDGKRFTKSEELSTAFSQTPAYDQLFMEIFTNTDVALEFINGLMPAELVKHVADEKKQADNPALALAD